MPQGKSEGVKRGRKPKSVAPLDDVKLDDLKPLSEYPMHVRDNPREINGLQGLIDLAAQYGVMRFVAEKMSKQELREQIVAGQNLRMTEEWHRMEEDSNV